MPTAGAERLAAIAEELADSCGGAEHSYAHAAQLLAQLGAHSNGGRPRVPGVLLVAELLSDCPPAQKFTW